MPSGVYLQGGTGSQKPGTQINSDLLWGAILAAIRPYDYTGAGGQILGHFRVAQAVVNTAAQTGPLFTWRWANAPSVGLMVPTHITCSYVLTTVFTTAQAIDIKATIARSYTISATGGTAIMPLAATKSNTMRTTMGASQVTDMRYGNVTSGTRLLDSQPFAVAPLANGNTALASTLPQVELYNILNSGDHPIVHAQNEGVEIAANTALGAAGVGNYYITVSWAEVVVF